MYHGVQKKSSFEKHVDKLKGFFHDQGMFGLSLGHMILLSFVVLLFGSKRLPELGNALGRGVGAFKKGLEGKDD